MKNLKTIIDDDYKAFLKFILIKHYAPITFVLLLCGIVEAVNYLKDLIN